jgi:hypothetical protein
VISAATHTAASENVFARAIKISLSMSLTGGGLMFAISIVDPTARELAWQMTIMMLVLGLVLTFYAQIKGHTPGKFRAPAVSQSSVLTIAGPVESAVRSAQRALVLVGAKDVRVETGTDARLHARVPMSWNSWGERLRLDFTSTSADAVQVRVASSPSFRLTLVDFGKNLQNVERIRDALARGA